MDKQTLSYYSRNAGEIFSRVDSMEGGISRHFKEAFPEKGVILDIGAGVGRDLRHLISEGHKAFGIEPCDELRGHFIHKYPSYSDRIKSGKLPGDLSFINIQFDGIVCSAVLMHIPREHLFDSLFAMKRALRKSGRLLISIPGDRPDIGFDRRDENGRLFTDILPEYLELLLERMGFQRIRKWKDQDGFGREGYNWITLLFELSDDALVRPIDQIESVLNRDKKVATYKLALFRALCDIAMTQFQRAVWLPNGRVGIPLQDISEKWVQYYWPLIEAPEFMPQIQGESESCTHPIAFRKPLMDLIDAYKKAGGFSAFVLDVRNDRISPQVRKQLKSLHSKMRNTIKTGPVTYAGGSFLMTRRGGWFFWMLVSGRNCR